MLENKLFKWVEYKIQRIGKPYGLPIPLLFLLASSLFYNNIVANFVQIL